MTTELFCTHIPEDATLIDILSAIEPFGKIVRIALSKKMNKEGDAVEYQSAFLTYDDPEVAKRLLEYGSNENKGKLVSEKLLSEKVIKILDEPVLILEKKTREELAQQNTKVDKRNLHLMYEGHITAENAVSMGVPPEEMAKRQKLFKDKQEKLIDTNFFFVPTRLCVMNVPDDIGTGRLRKIFAVAVNRYCRTHKKEEIVKEAAKNTVRITEVRQVPTQKGLFFIEFTRHDHALCALRQTNNNPDYFKDRRMIVEFAISSSFVLKDKKKKEIKKKEELTRKVEKKKQFVPVKYGFDTESEHSDEE